MDTQLSLNPLGVIDTVGGIFTAAANRRFQREMWADQKKYNTSERIAAQEYNTSERLATQAYNDPSAQMGRLMAAGINPNSATGMVEGVQSQPQSISGASASPSFTDQVNPLDLAQLSLISAQAQKASAEAKGQFITNETLGESNRLSIEQQKAAIKLALSSASYQSAMKDSTDQERQQSKQLFPLLMDKTIEEISQLKQSVSKTIEEIENLKKERSNIEKQGEVLDATKELTEAQAGVQSKQQEVLQYEVNQGQFEQIARDAGLDPRAPVGQAILRMILTNPKSASKIIFNTFDAASSAIGDFISKSKTDETPISKLLEFLGFRPSWHGTGGKF